MKDHDVFWKLGALSDQRLLERLGSMLGSSRRLMAELIAHLGEVEERRLHLASACSSMFAYCLKLGMTEDEAYRRIEVARLARRYPAIFPLLAEGQLSISVVALLKHYLSDVNHLDLLASAAGKTVAQTRELIAARFPRPDVASSVRKLPDRRTTIQPSLVLPTAPSPSETEPRFTSNVTAPSPSETAPSFTSNVTSSMEVPARAEPADLGRTGSSMTFAPAVNATCATGPEEPPLPTHSQRAAPPRPSSRVEPLSAQRYKVQLTASVELVRKLELAKDLMRHCQPDGELGPIVERALDLLIESLMQRRFGKSRKARPKSASERARQAEPEERGTRYSDSEERGVVMGDRSTVRGTAEPRTSTDATAELGTAESTMAEARGPTLDSADVQVERRGELERASTSSYIPRSTRREVVERDGLDCSWVDEHGVRCGSRAWLEYDHRCPRAKGGGSEPDNLRLLCRQHNRFAAEREYGRKHVEQTIAERRRKRAPHVPPAM